jgi:hypothetical protein
MLGYEYDKNYVLARYEDHLREARGEDPSHNGSSLDVSRGPLQLAEYAMRKATCTMAPLRSRLYCSVAA